MAITSIEEFMKAISLQAKPSVSWNNNQSYLDVPACLKVKDNGSWLFGYNGLVIKGDELQLYKKFTKRLKVQLGLGTNNKRCLVVFSHELDYDYELIKELIMFKDKLEGDNGQGLLYTVDENNIEYRCSAKLMKKSLEEIAGRAFAQCDEAEEDKLIILMEEIKKILASDDVQGKMSRVPLTPSGYAKRYIKEHTVYSENQKVKSVYGKLMSNLTLNEKSYKYVACAYQGGFCQANPNYVGQKLENIVSFDINSAYPSAIMSHEFPMDSGHFEHLTLKELELKLKSKLAIFFIKFKGLKSKGDFAFPINKNSCRLDDAVGIKFYNNKVISAQEVIVSMTNVDYECYKRYYSWESIEIMGDVLLYEKSLLPPHFLNSILHFYEEKTKLKGIPEKKNDYYRAKEKLNSCIGIIIERFHQKENQSLSDCLDKYNKSLARFTYMPWGVFATAYVRADLWNLIDKLQENFVYCDTDSIKCINDKENEVLIEAYNKEKIKAINKVLYNSHINPERVNSEYPLGIFINEGVYDYFKTLGEKKYICEVNGEGSICVAGLPKKEGGEYIFSQPDPWKFFDDGMYIPAEATGIEYLVVSEKGPYFKKRPYSFDIMKIDTYGGLFIL